MLRKERSSESSSDARKKLEVIRAAARHSFPTGDVERMVAETEAGYRAGSSS